MSMKYYKSVRLVDGKPRWVIVDENDNIVNKNPSKDELKGLEEEPYKRTYKTLCTDEELLDYPRQFYKKYGRSPTVRDFYNSPVYPSFRVYQRRFGSWSNALKLTGLDVESMVKKGVLITNNQKARLSEMMVIDHFEKNPVDLSGDNCKSPCDGICPNGKTYDVKSSRLHETYYVFSIKNRNREEIEIYYFLAFNEDYTKLEYAWRVPGEIIEKNYFQVTLNSWSGGKFTIDNMKEYDITDRLRGILKSELN